MIRNTIHARLKESAQVFCEFKFDRFLESTAEKKVREKSDTGKRAGPVL